MLNLDRGIRLLFFRTNVLNVGNVHFYTKQNIRLVPRLPLILWLDDQEKLLVCLTMVSNFFIQILQNS